MSHPTEAGELIARPATDGSTATLRNLYVVRFGFAIVWAGLLAATASTLNPLSVSLLVIYPLFDLAAAVYDFRSSGATRPRQRALHPSLYARRPAGATQERAPRRANLTQPRRGGVPLAVVSLGILNGRHR